MIPAGFPAVAPTATLADLFGPLAPVAVLAALAALGVLVALIAGESWMSLRRRRRVRILEPIGSGSASTTLRPAA